MKVIFLMMIGMSLLQADFIKDGDTVKDTQSNLEWQDNEVGRGAKWEEAIERCENLELAGHSDWRLPNINELKSIADSSRNYPAIVEAFKNTSPGGRYMSSTANQNKKRLNVVHFQYGSIGSIYRSESAYEFAYVRCVRGGE